MTGRLGSGALSSLIGDIYDCALEPAGWGRVMVRLTEAMDAAYATIALADVRDNQGRFAYHSPWSEDQMQRLQDFTFTEIPGLAAVVQGQVDQPLSTFSLISEATLQQTVFYRDWAGPQGLREACMVKFAHTTSRIGMVGCTITNTRPVISQAELKFLSLLSPHVRRAALIGDLLDQGRVGADLQSQTLNLLSVPVLLVSRSTQILFANDAAQVLLSLNGPLRSVSGQLRIPNPAAAKALFEAIGLAANGHSDVGSRGIGIPLSAPGEPPAIAYVLPLSGQRADVAIFIATASSGSPLPESLLSSLFDLTPAEARVLLLIGKGQSPAIIAEALNIGLSTAKTHLARIFAKTGTARQSDLVRLLGSISLPFVG